jgi:hypothetical protein
VILKLFSRSIYCLHLGIYLFIFFLYFKAPISLFDYLIETTINRIIINTKDTAQESLRPLHVKTTIMQTTQGRKSKTPNYGKPMVKVNITEITN